MVLVLTMVVLQSISFTNYALTTKTTNIIYGSAPYLTFDGGRTRVTNTEALLRISLSDGRTFTPTTNNSSLTNPIALPVAGQSSADIGMLVPTDTNSIALSSLIGTPYNYWGDDDGDGQGVNGVTATGSLNLSIVDKDDNRVARNEVLTICKAPYKLTLSNGEGRLTTRYGVPNESRFTAGNATYYINPKETTPTICYANAFASGELGISETVWKSWKGFLPQSFTPSSYGLNFPTTGANNFGFYLNIFGVNQALSWAPVSHGGITATMTNSTSDGVEVTLTGPFATYSQWKSENPGRIARPSLPQVFELVGRDRRGNAIVKYGFKLKQWFVNRGPVTDTEGFKYASLSSWCNKIGGYRVPKVKDLTNASCQGNSSGPQCQGAVGATPSSPSNRFLRQIGAGFISEWGQLHYYNQDQYIENEYTYYGRFWTNDKYELRNNHNFVVSSTYGEVTVYDLDVPEVRGVCVYP